MSECIVARISTAGKTKAQAKADAVVRNARICQHCGKEYVNKRRHKNEGNKYCSRACSFAALALAKTKLPSSIVHWKECNQCGKTFLARRKNKLRCSPECDAKVANEYASNAYKEWYLAEVEKREHISCVECGTKFTPTNGSKACSVKCATRYQRRKSRHKLRARKKAVEYENVNPYLVFYRDGWRCQICGKATPMNRRGSCMTNAPELDHRIPLSKGGTHTYSNVQCACRKCNQDKGNRSERGQYPLLNI